MHRLQHIRVVRLLGVIMEEGHYSLVMEYMKKGSLMHVLKAQVGLANGCAASFRLPGLSHRPDRRPQPEEPICTALASQSPFGPQVRDRRHVLTLWRFAYGFHSIVRDTGCD